MIAKKNAAAGMVTRRAAANFGCRDSTRPGPASKPLDATICDALLAHSIRAEETALAAGWLDPVGLNDAAFRFGLTGKHFTSGLHSGCFWYLCNAAGRGEHVSQPLFCEVANRSGIDVELSDLDFILTEDVRTEALPLYVEAVRDFAEKRERARALLHELGQLGALTNAPGKDTQRPTTRLVIPGRLKGRYQRGR